MADAPNNEQLERLVYLLAIGGKEINRRVTPDGKRLNWSRLGAVHPLTKELVEESTDIGIFQDTTPRDVRGKINTGMVIDTFPEYVSNGVMGIARVKSIQPSMARGCRVMPFMARIADVRLNIIDGTWEGSHMIWGCPLHTGSLEKGGWKWLENAGFKIQHGLVEAIEKRYSRSLAIVMGLQWIENMWWTVDVRLGEAPGVRWFVTAEALYELWDIRDRCRPSDRIKKLIHWVRRHNRKRPSTGECDVVVRKHLRGALAFQWNEMDVSINPAYDDLSKLHNQGLAKHIPDYVDTPEEDLIGTDVSSAESKAP